MPRDESPNTSEGSRSGDRLQKLISRAGLASRRAAEDLIREGRVTINGRIAELGERADLERDAVKVDGRRLQPVQEHHTLALNKPKNVVTTLSDPEGRRTVLDLVPPRYRKGLFPIGRLDFATEGLLLLTTDGDLAQRVSHPRHGCRKLYEVKVKGHPSEQALDRLRRGFRLHGQALAPVEIERRIPPGPKRGDGAPSNTWWKVTLVQGKTRQIREMFQRIGHPVQRLRRTQIGPVRLLGLRPGNLRELGDEELSRLAAAVDQGERDHSKGKSGRGKAPSKAPHRGKGRASSSATRSAGRKPVRGKKSRGANGARGADTKKRPGGASKPKSSSKSTKGRGGSPRRGRS